MAVVALNWELGGDLGHVGRFLPIALGLRERGHRPVLLLRDISRADALLGPQDLEYLQAPVWQVQVSGLPDDINLTETLFRFGYLHSSGLLSMARAWRAAWALLQPSLLLFDHAPTAMLAARGLGAPRVVIGTGFSIPPRARPLPPFRWWKDNAGERARLEETEQRATRNANSVLQQIGAPPIRQVSDLFEAEAAFLCSSPELDAHGERPGGNYLGPIGSLDLGADPRWPEGNGARVFAYLKPGYRHFEALLGALGRNAARVIVFAPGAPEAICRRHAAAHLAVSTAPLRMRAVAEQCDAVICHAGSGVTEIALGAGKPVLLLPMQMEQTMTAHRVAALGAGLVQPIESNPANLPKLVKQLIGDPELARRAEAFASRRGTTGQQAAVATVVDTCDRLLRAAAENPAQPGR